MVEHRLQVWAEVYKLDLTVIMTQSPVTRGLLYNCHVRLLLQRSFCNLHTTPDTVPRNYCFELGQISVVLSQSGYSGYPSQATEVLAMDTPPSMKTVHYSTNKINEYTPLYSKVQWQQKFVSWGGKSDQVSCKENRGHSGGVVDMITIHSIHTTYHIRTSR